MTQIEHKTNYFRPQGRDFRSIGLLSSVRVDIELIVSACFIDVFRNIGIAWSSATKSAGDQDGNDARKKQANNPIVKCVKESVVIDHT